MTQKILAAAEMNYEEQDFTARIEKYAIGIDLGTTHCVVSYTPLGIDSDLIETEILPIPQLTSRVSLRKSPASLVSLLAP